MTNSEHNLTAEQAIDTLMSLLNEELISSKIDAPIDAAVREFQFDVKLPFSHSDFNRLIGAFVSHMYQKGLRLPRHLSKEEALTEAISLLERYYQGGNSKGYDGALMDGAGDSLEDLEFVLFQLAASIKAAQRNKYVQWAFFSIVDQSDWKTRRQLAAVYLVKYGDFLSRELREKGPSMLVDNFQDLINNHVSVQGLLRQIVRGDAS